jgi:hypothetical protein
MQSTRCFLYFIALFKQGWRIYGVVLFQQGSNMHDFRYRNGQIQQILGTDSWFLNVAHALLGSFQQAFARGYISSTRCFLVSKVGVYQIQKLRMNLSGS